MLALHALWWGAGEVGLWAERRADPTGDGPRHPFALGAGTIRSVLAAAGPGLEYLAGQGSERFVTLAIPSNEEGPQASPELDLELEGPFTPRDWRVPVLVVDGAPLLGELFDTGSWSGGLVADLGSEGGEVDVAYGGSLRWLIALHDEAYRTVRAGQVLPVVAAPGSRARWVAAPSTYRRWHEFALAAPAMIRTGVDEIMEDLVDAEARAILQTRPPLLGVGRGRRALATEPVELWLQALTASDSTIGADLGRLPVTLAAWSRSLVTSSRLRVCFRLREPEASTAEVETWTLDLLLQLADTPGVTIAAADVWEGGAALRTLEREIEDPVATFLAELARAASLHGLLRRALTDDRAAELFLSRAEALEFLRTGAVVLVEAGFGVLLPTWWDRAQRNGPSRVGLSLQARATPDEPLVDDLGATGSTSTGVVPLPAMLNRSAVLDVRWDVVLAGARLTREELLDLAEATVPLVRVRGRWVEVDPAQITAALVFLERAKSLSLREVARLALDPGASIDGLDVLEVDADGPLGELLTGSSPALVAPPEHLRPYQREGVAWLAQLARLGLGGVLADDMGLGKTVQVLALLAQAHQAGGGGQSLVVCPLSMVGTWQREAQRFAPGLSVHVHHGPARELATADLVITTYGLLLKDLELRAVAWNRVILDEAQTVKNPTTQLARAVKSLHAEQRIALTGTPVENRLADLHTLLDITNPGLFGSLGSFTARWSIPVERDSDLVAATDLTRRIRPVLMRRVKSEVAEELPAREEMTVWCTLTAEQAGLYKAVVDDMMTRLKGAKGVQRRGAVLSSLTRLRQVCNHPAHLLKDGSALAGRSGKLARLEQVLDTSASIGDRTLCFTQFTAFGSRLAEHLTARSGAEVPFLHGGLTAAQRESLVRRFQAGDGPAVMVLSLKAGGTGLTLTAANQVVHVDRWWNPAVEDQASDRVHRIGQTRDVQIRKLVCVGTLEERIDAMLRAKRGVAGLVLSGAPLTEVGDDELEALVALDAASVQEPE